MDGTVERMTRSGLMNDRKLAALVPGSPRHEGRHSHGLFAPPLALASDTDR
jgi:hypothetical protein